MTTKRKIETAVTEDDAMIKVKANTRIRLLEYKLKLEKEKKNELRITMDYIINKLLDGVK